MTTGRGFELQTLETQAKATQEVAKNIALLEQRLASLEKIIELSSASSGRVAKSLNWLTGALVFIGTVSAYIQFSVYIQ